MKTVRKKRQHRSGSTAIFNAFSRKRVTDANKPGGNLIAKMDAKLQSRAIGGQRSGAFGVGGAGFCSLADLQRESDIWDMPTRKSRNGPLAGSGPAPRPTAFQPQSQPMQPPTSPVKRPATAPLPAKKRGESPTKPRSPSKSKSKSKAKKAVAPAPGAGGISVTSSVETVKYIFKVTRPAALKRPGTATGVRGL